MYGEVSIVNQAQIGVVADETLAQRARAGYRAAYTMLTARYRDVAFAYAYARLRNREEAEDLAQEVFVRAWFALESFRTSGNWAPWLMRIMRNACLDALRRKRIRLNEPLPDEWLDTSPSPEVQALAQEQKRELTEALDALPEAFRIPLLMHYASGQKCREIALALDVPESTVKGRIATGLKRLRKELDWEETR